MKPYRMIFCDLDGTLLDDDKHISELTFKTARELRNQGVYFCVATGRPQAGIEKNWTQWQLDELADVVIGINGAMIWDQGKREDVYFLTPAAMRQIQEIFDPLKPKYYIYDLEHVYANENDEKAKELQRINQVAYRYADMKKLMEQPQPKIALHFRKEDVAKTHDILEHLVQPLFRGVYSGVDFIEFSDARVSKANAIKLIAERYGCTMNEVVAFGNEGNDIDMLQEAGLGVCVANGNPVAKAAADDLTKEDNNHSGVALYLRTLFHLD